ncbi:RidA family protein [Micromonospora sp. WMMD1155]|uniref:RidA family protein n=1 Tax=Micromonospora sp. WMMD1155 TaxID=3016094 RepID=UPI00249AC3FA|nr:RidA family protein [Micromonospora sp. WMMD1155]WFE53270.1 RidA family protein [Micromonospora sp. WMMD1155]
MSVEFLHPEGLLKQTDYSPVAVGTGTRTILLAGQAGVTPDFKPAAPDLAGQVEAALRNIIIGVRGAGGDAGDLARLTFYIVDWSADKWDDVLAGITRVQQDEGLPNPAPPITIIGIQALFTPDFVVEIEATAILN